LGAVLRNRVTGLNARTADAVGGTFVSALSLLVVAWVFGTLVANSEFKPVRTQVKNSAIIRTVDDVMPEPAQTRLTSFQGVVRSGEFRQGLNGRAGESAVQLRPPDESVLNNRALKTARASIVKIVSTAPQCQRRIEGTGFVFAPEHIMTNAHVVAGARGPSS